MSNEMVKKEVYEAITAGERALTSLKSAQGKLNSARGWGMVDMFGGGLFTDLMKHSRLNDASSYLERAKYDLQVFQRELRDVSRAMDLKIEIGGFLSFVDFFFDGIVADFLVQSKIAEAREQLEDAIYHVEHLLRDLKERYTYM